MEAQSGKCGQGGGLVEHIEVPESELLLNSFSNLEGGLVFFLVSVIGTQSY